MTYKTHVPSQARVRAMEEESEKLRQLQSEVFATFYRNCFFFTDDTLREGCTKQKPEKVWSFAKPGGGGVSEGSKMPNLYFGVLKRVKNGQKTH